MRYDLDLYGHIMAVLLVCHSWVCVMDLVDVEEG